MDVAILISDKIDFKPKKVTRDKDGHYIMIKRTIHQEDITVINIHASNTVAPKYIKQLLTGLKEETDNNNTIIVNPILTSMDRSSRQKVNKQTVALNETLDQMDFINLYRTFHPNAVEYTFFSSADETFSRIDHVLGHKTKLSKFKKTETISNISSEHNGMKLKLNYKKKTGKITNMWRLNNTLLNNYWVNKKTSKKKLKLSKDK